MARRRSRPGRGHRGPATASGRPARVARQAEPHPAAGRERPGGLAEAGFAEGADVACLDGADGAADLLIVTWAERGTETGEDDAPAPTRLLSRSVDIADGTLGEIVTLAEVVAPDAPGQVVSAGGGGALVSWTMPDRTIEARLFTADGTALTDAQQVIEYWGYVSPINPMDLASVTLASNDTALTVLSAPGGNELLSTEHMNAARYWQIAYGDLALAEVTTTTRIAGAPEADTVTGSA